VARPLPDEPGSDSSVSETTDVEEAT